MSVQTLDVRHQEYSHGKILEHNHEGCEELQSASPNALALGLSCPFWSRNVLVCRLQVQSCRLQLQWFFLKLGHQEVLELICKFL